MINPERKIRIYAFGISTSWADIQREGSWLREQCMIEEFARHPFVDGVVVVNLLPRNRFLEVISASLLGLVQNRSEKRSKVLDVYLSHLLPQQRGGSFLGLLNSRLTKFFLWAQTRRLSEKKSVSLNWCYLPKGVMLAKRLANPGPIAFDLDHNLVDDVNRWKTLSQSEKEEILVNCARYSTWMFCSSRSMISWMQQRGFNNIYRLRNGVDPLRFQKKEFRSGGQKEKRPVIGYSGVLSPWINFELLCSLIQRKPDWQFVIVGPWYRMEPLPELTNAQNVKLLGKVEAKDLPLHIAKFDVALGLYKSEEWLDVDSMKLFEYIAAKIPIVSTEFHPYLESDFDGLVRTASTPEEFIEKINEILAWTEKEKEAWENRCESFSTNHTWEKIVAQVLDTIRRGESEGKINSGPAALLEY